MATLARGRMKAREAELVAALTGRVNDHHRFMLKAFVEQVEQVEKQIDAFDARIEQVMTPFEKEAISRLDGIPGINRTSAQNIVAEIGVDMGRFPTAEALASWAGICPGNNESAGKRKSGRITQGNRWLKRTLAQCALAAANKNGSFLQARFRRLAARRGRKRAAVAVGHSQLTVIHEMLKDGSEYHDLGANYVDQLQRERIKRNLVSRLEGLGFDVNLSQRPEKQVA